MVELPLDGREVGEDVRVVELEVVQHGRARPVVDELRALVEERRVVFVGLDREEARRREPRRAVEVHRHAAHEEAGFESGVLQDPREHRGRRRLAVRARDGEHPAVAQHGLGEPLRPGHVREPAIEDRFHQRIAARDDVADDEEVGAESELVETPAFDEADALRLELRAHRRIDVGIAAGDGVAGLAGDGGDAAHERAADAEDVDVHGARCAPDGARSVGGRRGF